MNDLSCGSTIRSQVLKVTDINATGLKYEYTTYFIILRNWNDARIFPYIWYNTTLK